MGVQLSRDRALQKILLPVLMTVLVFMAALGLMTGIGRSAPVFVAIPSLGMLLLGLMLRDQTQNVADRVALTPTGLILRHRGIDWRLTWSQIGPAQTIRVWGGERVRVHLRDAGALGPAVDFYPIPDSDAVRRLLAQASDADKA
jgi:FtsP/CotA-like multicopper oxidase with cupredoxin domain